MSSKSQLGLGLALVAVLHVVAAANASEQNGRPTLKTALIPRKAPSAQARSLECVQRRPDFVLWDAEKQITPGAVGYVYYLEQSQGNRLLLTDQAEGMRGWAHANTIIPVAQADEFFSKEIQANPKSAFAFLMRGVVRLENDDLERALTDLDQALKLDPKSVPALTARAYLWMWKGEFDRAIADSTRSIELDPNYGYAYVERGIFHYDRKDFDNALHDFDAAAKRGFKGAVIEVGRGMIDLQKGNLKKAQEEFNEALKIDPKHPDAYAGCASIFLVRGNTKRALTILDQAVELDPENADSHGNRAIVLLSIGKYDKALEDLDDVLRVAPSSARAHRERAWILATCPVDKLRNGEEAVKLASTACELTAWSEPHALMTLAAACSEARDYDGAVKWQQKAIELLSDKDPEKREYKKLLDRYQAKKPYHRLGLLEEIGLQTPGPAAKKSQ
jgi:tetratricopeptide (TPR) repeat protein